MDEIKISVIIPFYNAKDYVTQAVESALNQPETGEVLLIEDNSPDGGLQICRELADKFSKVKLFRHPDGKNHGAAASRNLGIRNATLPFVAFLDADDYYLPDRFHETVEVFNRSKEVDGVYEAIGVTYQNDKVKELFTKLSFKEITTIKDKIDPDALFEKVIEGHFGHFSFDGFTVRKETFRKTGLFSEELKMYEDTELMLKLCARAILLPGSIDQPIAIRRVHDKNRITYQLAEKRSSYTSYNLLWSSLSKWGRRNLTKNQQKMVLHRYVSHLRKIDTFVDFSLADFFTSRKVMFELGISFPELLLDNYFWRRIIPSRQIFNLNGRI